MITLVIMDGFGVRKKKKGNAILLQGVPNLHKLKKLYPHTLLNASGNAVGLPSGQMGNSEAGHLTIGAGRRFYQPLEKINRAIKDGSFFENSELLKAISHAKRNKSALHILGLASDGGVHSHINHIKTVLELAKKQGLQKVFVHAILDGRDTGTMEGKNFVDDLQKFCKASVGKVATLCGRAWAMDREKYFDRTEKFYNAFVLSKSKIKGENPLDEIQEQYDKNITDEFLEPVVLENAPLKDGDAIICCNIRKDRMRQILQTLTDKKFDKFKVKNFENLCIVGMVEYGKEFATVGVAFPEEKIENCFAEVLADNNKSQLHISETAKFAHVTYYFNCGREKPYKNEDQKLLQSVEDIKYDNHPEMRAFDITSEVMNAIASEKKFDFIVVNFPNCDMIGHTANMEATKTAVKVVDKCAYAIAMASLMAGGECVITADHGNAEELFEKNGEIKTSHTTNPVPFIVVSDKRYKLKKGGELANIASTILDMMGIERPKEMAESLIRK